MRSILPETLKSPSSSPRWSSTGAPLVPNATSKRRGTRGRPSATSWRTKCSRSRQASARARAGSFPARRDARHRRSPRRGTPAGRRSRRRGAPRRVSRSRAAWQAAVEPVQRLVGNAAAHARVEDRVDLLGRHDSLEEPHRRAVVEALELGDGEALALLQFAQHERVGEPRHPGEGGQRALDAPFPAVGASERSLPRVTGRERGDAAQAFALGRRLVDVPRETRERTTPRGALHLGGIEQRAHLLVEGARLARPASSSADSRTSTSSSHGACTRCRRGSGRGRARRDGRGGAPLLLLSPDLVRQERRLGSAAGEDAFLEPEDEHRVEAARACAHEVEHGNAPGLARSGQTNRRALERADELVRPDLFPRPLHPSSSSRSFTAAS